MRIVSLPIAATTVIGGSAHAQATKGQNSGAGVRSAPGNKSGPAVTTPLKNLGEQSSG